MQSDLLDPRLVLFVLCLYMGFLVLIALMVERRTAAGRSPADNPWVYSLSLAVYCTAWTYYGSVGKAATSGMLFMPIYLGPTLSIFLWWTLLRKLVRLKVAYRITSIADFISIRYNRSQPLAALATLIALAGILPYISLQLKAVITTFAVISAPIEADPSFNGLPASWLVKNVGLVVVVLLTAFTIVLGVRRLDPTERHEGMVAALAVECVVKLVAFLLAGIFVTYFIYNGFGDLFSRLAASSLRGTTNLWGERGFGYSTWASYFLLSMSAIVFLPRQFHVAVVENSDEKHILTAMWLLPLYMLLINVFVLPIALAGLLQGLPLGDADKFVLLLPLRHAAAWLPLLVFIGGFSAAAGMIMITSMTMATMITNHLLLPFVEWSRYLRFLKRHLLKCRWATVTALIAAGYWFEERIFQPYMLVSIGLISFAAVLQFAPPILGGILWRRGNKAGALLGLAAGFAVWCYTQLIPSFVRNGWLSHQLLTRGPWGIALLKPEKLFGLVALDPLSHTVIWSMFFNIGCYVVGSLYFESGAEERSLAAEFVGSSPPSGPLEHAQQWEAYIELAAKRREVEKLFRQYFTETEVNNLVARCLAEAGISGADLISISQLVEFHGVVEKNLAGSIGSAAAHKALQQEIRLTPRERRDLSEVYAEILANLKVTPTQLKAKIDYYQERETLLITQAHELEEKVRELENEIKERQRIQAALTQSEERYRGLVETMNEGLEIEDEHGVITYVNDRLCEMWGCSRSEIIEQAVSSFVEESQQRVLQEQRLKLRQGEMTANEITWLGKPGNKICTLVSAVPMFNANGRYQGSFSVITDISKLKALEREKANLVSMFAHDMRSSLTGIHGLGLRLLTKGDLIDESKRLEYLKIINREATKLESLVDDFLEFSRLETGRLRFNFTHVALDRELEELFEAYQVRAAQKDLHLQLEMETALPAIKADANRLRRVFTNLLDNALKFSKERTAVTILCHETDEEICISIRDEGMGIDPQELPYIFDLFHRGPQDEEKDGYGIGLATVKAIVEGHKGRITVESRLGEGSIFKVFLPKMRMSP